MIFCELDKKEYIEFLDSNPLRTFFQSPLLDPVEKENGWSFLYVGVKKNNKIVAASRLKYITVRFNKKLFYAPRGLLLDYNDDELLEFFISNLKKYLKKLNGFTLHINPPVIYKERDNNGDIVEGGIDNSNLVTKLKKLGFKHMGFNEGYNFKYETRWSYELPTKDKTYEDIFKEMTTKKRKSINKAEHLNVKVKELSYDELPIFKDILDSTSERRSFTCRSLEYFQNMYRQFVDTNNGKVLLAYVDLDDVIKILREDIKNLEKEKEKGCKYKKEQFEKNMDSQIENVKSKIEEFKLIKNEKGNILYLSSAFFINYGKEVLYHFSGSFKEYMYFSAQTLLQWVMIKEAIDLKKECYNFYGISGIFDPKDPDYGVFLFKKEFGGHVIEYIGDFYMPLSWYYYLHNFIGKIKRK